jgi:hypothetical protein
MDMKKLVTLFLAAGMVGAVHSNASAIDVEMDGAFNFQYTQAHTLDGTKIDAETQFVEVGAAFTASENLSGYFRLWSKWEWGNNEEEMGGSGGLGNYQKAYVKMAYIDWTVPGTPVKIRMGRQELELPAVALDKNPVLWSSDPSDGIAISADVTDWLSLATFWSRYDRQVAKHGAPFTTHHATTADVFGVVADLKFEGFQFKPYFAFAAQDGNTMDGSDSNNALTPAPGVITFRDGSTAGTNYGNNTFWLGVNGEMSLFDPLTVKADFLYGDRDFRSHTGLPGQHGWWVDGAVSYKTDYGTPELAAWFGSDDDKDVKYAYQKNMPTMCGRFGGSFGFFNGSGLEDNYLPDNHTGLGTWGVRLAMQDISFIDDLSHTVPVIYASGTNANKNAVFGLDPWAYMTHKDSMVEFDLGTEYEIYKNLKAYLEMAYIIEDFQTRKSGSYNARAGKYDNGWQIALQLTYEF